VKAGRGNALEVDDDCGGDVGNHRLGRGSKVSTDATKRHALAHER